MLAEPPPAGLTAQLGALLPFHALLADEERAKLRDDVRIFLAEKRWEPCGGLPLTEQMRLTVAGWACLLILGRTIDDFDVTESILLYPDAFQVPTRSYELGGLALEFEEELLGEAWRRGPVVLSWQEIEEDRATDDARNLILHEFAHQLDTGAAWTELDRAVPGWRATLRAAYDQLVQAVECGKPHLLDGYGATDPAEFFAVATECFFERPRELLEGLPELYGVLSAFYRQNPAARLAGAP